MWIFFHCAKIESLRLNTKAAGTFSASRFLNPLSLTPDPSPKGEGSGL